MPMNKEFLAGFFEGVENADERIEKILKEHEADTTGIKVNRDSVLKENKDFKERIEKSTQERETEKSAFQKRIEELEAKVKAAGSDEAKAWYESEIKKFQDMHTAKLADHEKAAVKSKAEFEELYAKYLGTLESAELDKAMDGVQGFDRSKAGIFRSLFKDRFKFSFKEVDGAQKLLGDDYRSIADTVNAFVGTDEGKFFVNVTSSGGGAPGSTSAKPTVANPFMKGKNWNLTEQGRIFKEDPARAGRLKKEAEEASS